jgi:copper chaperone NosL
MQNNPIDRLQIWIRVVLLLCSIGLVIILFVPMWRIDLQAPQYPEGLMLLIYPNKLAGNVDIINGLNHYIGMKTLHTKDFIEFTVLPYIISFFAIAFLTTAIIGKRKLLYWLCTLFICFGILAMYDFWRWEYNYGHNLNPEAAIVVPGMAYQPPLIGFKQLLNFGAYSMPHIGGWIFVSVGMLVLFCTVLAWKSSKQMRVKQKLAKAVAPFIFMVYLSSCSAKVEPIKIGNDNCYFCKMTISDERFGAELLTKKGKAFKFDDVHCIISYLKAKDIVPQNIKDVYLTNFCENHELVNVNQMLLLKSDAFKSPMNGNIAAFNNKDSLQKVQQRLDGNIVNWKQLLE